MLILTKYKNNKYYLNNLEYIKVAGYVSFKDIGDIIKNRGLNYDDYKVILFKDDSDFTLNSLCDILSSKYISDNVKRLNKTDKDDLIKTIKYILKCLD